MEAIEYFKIKKRLCEGNCENCPLSSYNNEFSFNCDDYEQAYPEKAIATAEKWAREHPVKTYKDDFLEKFPKAAIDYNCLRLCRKTIYGGGECPSATCKECWNEPYEE